MSSSDPAGTPLPPEAETQAGSLRRAPQPTSAFRCAICAAPVPGESRGWVDLEDMPRLWFCAEHWEEAEPKFRRAFDGTWLWIEGDVVALRAVAS